MKALALSVALLAGCNFLPDHFGTPRTADAQTSDTPDGPDADMTPDDRKLVVIPAGSALEGDRDNSDPANPDDALATDALPFHLVYTSEFKLSQRCINQPFYDECVAAGMCTPVAQFDQITRDQAATFCAWRGMRLPTEAELEKAMRGQFGNVPTLTGINTYGVDLASCDAQWVADGYQCDAYLNAVGGLDPMVPVDGTHPPLWREFSPVTGARQRSTTPPLGFRCAETTVKASTPAGPGPDCNLGNGCTNHRLGLGKGFGCAARGGSVYCWGIDRHGALGVGTQANRWDALPATWSRKLSIGGTMNTVAVGDDFACTINGANAMCWGHNNAGQLGTNDTADRDVPTIVTAAVQVHAAGTHACATTASGIKCWGHGGYTPSGSGATTPTAIGISANELAVGPDTDCAITGSNEVSCWGSVYNNTGTLTTVTPANANKYTVTNPGRSGAEVGDLAVGAHHVCVVSGALTAVSCWGDRTAFGGTGVATSPEVVASTLTDPKVFASRTGTVIYDGATKVAAYNVNVPDGDGIDIGFDVESAVAGGCSTNGGRIYCSGVEHGQLGHSNGCDATPLTNVELQLP